MIFIMRIICDVASNISIWSDEHQYIVRVKRNSGQKDKHAECRYFPSLDYCFQEVFDYLCKQRLTDGGSKTLTEMSEIIRNTKKEIKNILEPFVNLESVIKPRHGSVEARQNVPNPQGDTLEVEHEN